MRNGPGAGHSAQREYGRRRRAWRRRFLTGLPAAAVAAAAAAWWVGWNTTAVPELGVAAGAMVLAAYTAAFGRTPAHVTAWRAGAAGEQATARLLRPLARRGAVVLHDRAIPLSRANIDHLMIGRAVAAVDSKEWRARGARVTLSRDGTLWYGDYPQTKTVSTVRWEARRAAEELTRATGRPVTVTPVIAVHGAPVGRTGRLTVDGVRVVEARRLRRLLKRLPGSLSTDDVRRLAAAAERTLPPAR